jgi:3-oxoacyl-[acyl-carrier protein] reductase
MFTSVAGRAVVITGGTRGIGKGIARVFARAGARVLLTGRDAKAAQRAAEEIVDEIAAAEPADGRPQIVATVVDVTDPDALTGLAATAKDRLGGIDVLCLNAGIFPETRLRDMTPNDVDLVLDTNLRGNILALTACLPLLEHSSHGRVILTSSITGPITGYPGWAHYGASKAGQLGFMRTAALELARSGITRQRGHARKRLGRGAGGSRVRVPAPDGTSHSERATRFGRGHRPCRPFPGNRRGGLHHRPDHRHRWRASASRICGSLTIHLSRQSILGPTGAGQISRGPSA